MYLAALFLLAAATMLTAWLGRRVHALWLLGLSLTATIAVYLHHATDVLRLSF
jgi:hypothetical protein